MLRSGTVRLAGPGLVVRGGPECGSFGLGPVLNVKNDRLDATDFLFFIG